ncbi:MAG TPA: DUF1080 domain-containing protein [Rhodothermales bacterium]|nr:DUF1080 domain-containing protein [Rhodothermales bacterium]
MKRSILMFAIALSSLGLAAAVPGGWVDLFDGKTMDGWHLKAVHGGRGGIWTVENGALVANQAADHTGGLIGTDETYSDFEITLEFQADYPVDTGLFLRTREDGMGYQVTLDYRDDGFVGSLYAPAEGGFLVQYPDWRKLIKETGWNTLRARIEGQPAHVQAWLNGVQTLDFTDSLDRYPREGYVGLQVHGGEGAWGADSRARFRNIKLRKLDD